MRKDKLKNHIIFLIDSSGSMDHLKDSVISVFNQQMEHIIETSKKTEQETRVSVYTFDNAVNNICWDVDCLRSPSIEKFYKIGGMTAMLDAFIVSIDDVSKIPQIYGDYSQLIIAISDGGNNVNNYRTTELKRKINALSDGWGIVFLGPDKSSIEQAVSFGIPRENCKTWDITSSKGVADVGATIKTVVTTYMDNRAKGIKGKGLFSLQVSNLSGDVFKNLEQLNSKNYTILHVRKDSVVKEFVESWKIPFVQGAAYYQLTKTEKIQVGKHICIKEKSTGKVFTGDNARNILGLPNYEVKIAAASHPKYDIFIQSISVNRKLIAGTELLVMI